MTSSHVVNLKIGGDGNFFTSFIACKTPHGGTELNEIWFLFLCIALWVVVLLISLIWMGVIIRLSLIFKTQIGCKLRLGKYQ
jgi:hypothetical protein